MEHTEEYVKLENVSKIYGSKEVKIIAVDEISFRIKKGEFDKIKELTAEAKNLADSIRK